MTNIENNICEAIELIVNKSIYEASYDKTIQGIIQLCDDATIGKYKIKYQDSTFYAYSTNTEVIYAPGTSVYILVPGNDMTHKKTIVGTVDQLGANYNPQIEGDSAYDRVGTNCILEHPEYHISSYSKPNKNGSYIKPLYYFNTETGSYIGDIKIDQAGLKTYLGQSKTLICGGYIQTNLAVEQQTRGNYGIVFGLDFLDNATGQAITRYYTVDVDNMTGNPYNLKLGKRQYGIFTIDGTNFDKISSISLFVKDFPHQKEISTIEEQKLFDINISALELVGANPMSQAELNTCGISFETPDGTIFSKGAHDYDKLRITAKVKVKGKMLNPEVQKLPFYWFQEDASIKNNSKFYNSYGGRGWKCLNKYNVITEATEDSPAQIEWLPAKDTYILKFSDIKAKETLLKCVVAYNDVFYSKTLLITNMTTDLHIKVESDKGIQFYYDMGRPNLTCTVESASAQLELPLTYIWGREDVYGNFMNLPTDIEYNKQTILDYNNAIRELTALQEDIKNGIKFANAEKTNLQNLQNNVDAFAKKEFIENNILHNVAVNQITDLAKYKCSVFDNQHNFLGTGSITLLNSLEMRDGYRLVINNGIQSFQYDEYGMSPTSASLVKPQILPALNFTIFDNLGRPIEKEVLAQCDIVWKIPRQHSMVLPGNLKAEEQEKDDDFYYFKNTLDLAYKLQKKYFYNYKNNDITLEVVYKDTKLIASTDFTFLKMGDSGTNGTEYTCKIVPNSDLIQEDVVPMFTTIAGSNIGHFNFKYGTEGSTILNSEISAEAPFKLQLFKSGELIFDNFQSGDLLGGKESVLPDVPDVEISWEFLQNHYKSLLQDRSYLTIVKNNDTIEGKISGAMSYSKESNENPNVAHILKCTVKYHDTTLFATLPIIFAEVKEGYEIQLKHNTGFQSVIYTSDGLAPKYDNTYPFTIDVYQNINGVKEKVSLLPSEVGINEFEWTVLGQKCNYSEKELAKALVASHDIIHSKMQPKDIQKNQCVFKPMEHYDGCCVTNAIFCSCAAGTIHIPIHLVLNKYGLAHLNDWDGNTIQLNKDGGFILSPQMGAGTKNKDNTFTGVLMGEVQQPNKMYSDIGLLGYNRGLQTFKLDAKTGAALFGPTKGQIIIDPSAQKAMLYSHDYWNDYDIQTGLPKSYEDDNKKLSGMLIDLTAPKIEFGNGNFSVDEKGKLIAKNGLFTEDCQFQGTINTNRDANVGQNLYLDYDSQHSDKYSRIVLNADVDGFPSVAFLKKGSLHHLRLGGLDLNNTSAYYNYANIGLFDEGSKHKIQLVAPNNNGEINMFSGPENDYNSFSLNKNSCLLTASNKQQFALTRNGISVTGVDKSGRIKTGKGLTGHYTVQEGITTVNGLVIEAK